MNVFIDTEFDDPTHQLISLALITEDGQREFYEVLDVKPTDTWVVQNVMPYLEKPSVSKASFQHRLKRFLGQFPRVTILADHPNDIRYLAQAMITDDQGSWFELESLRFELNTELSSKGSEVPHNALHDVRAIRRSYFTLEGIDPYDA